MGAVDLHVHSTASDGSLTPREVVRLAAEKKLTAIALTDHDSINGLEEAVEAGRTYGVEVIRGCELAMRAPYCAAEMHLLGLFLPPEPLNLVGALDTLLEWRRQRNMVILDKLSMLGKPVYRDEVLEVAGSATVGRPHIAAVMLRKGFVSSLAEAFSAYLGDRGAAYEPKEVFGPEEAIGTLKKDGSLAVLAHPYLLGLSLGELEILLRRLIPYGLDGLEAWHSEQPAHITSSYIELADRLGLAVSGGSDFHGTVKPTVELGRVKGGGRVPEQALTSLKERLKKQRKQADGDL